MSRPISSHGRAKIARAIAAGFRPANGLIGPGAFLRLHPSARRRFRRGGRKGAT
jgi:hypothetical protein